MTVNQGLTDSRTHLYCENHTARAERKFKNHLVPTIFFTDEEIGQEKLNSLPKVHTTSKWGRQFQWCPFSRRLCWHFLFYLIDQLGSCIISGPICCNKEYELIVQNCSKWLAPFFLGVKGKEFLWLGRDCKSCSLNGVAISQGWKPSSRQTPAKGIFHGIRIPFSLKVDKIQGVTSLIWLFFAQSTLQALPLCWR